VTPPPGPAPPPATPLPPPGAEDGGADAPLKHLYSGKVREVYQLPGGPLLLVATDRISAYDYVLPTLIPDKGKIPTTWWTPPSRPGSPGGPWPASRYR